ncbi:MAG: hypothetical protein JWR42_2334 [Marmoricola sp.]|nr:hypothetical protein [Marmoricola sp.]
MNLDDVLERAARRGVDLSTLVVGREPDHVPQAPSHRWIAFPSSTGGTVIGGADRGRFAPYAEFTDLLGAADALAQLTSTPPPRPLDRARSQVLGAAATIGRDWAAGLQQRPWLPGTDVPVGTPLDHIGNESGHYLYLYDTPMSQRSLPPTDLEQHRTGYLVAAPLPPEAVVEQLPPWFGQPGGGLVVRLPRVIRSYVDAGLLLPFDPASLTP